MWRSRLQWDSDRGISNYLCGTASRDKEKEPEALVSLGTFRDAGACCLTPLHQWNPRVNNAHSGFRRNAWKHYKNGFRDKLKKTNPINLFYQYFSPCPDFSSFPVTSTDILRENITCHHRDTGYSGAQICVPMAQGLVTFPFLWQRT